MRNECVIIAMIIVTCLFTNFSYLTISNNILLYVFGTIDLLYI